MRTTSRLPRSAASTPVKGLGLPARKSSVIALPIAYLLKPGDMLFMRGRSSVLTVVGPRLRLRGVYEIRSDSFSSREQSSGD